MLIFFQDLLVSQSDYVKTELKSLQRDVQDLEESGSGH